MHAHWLTHTQPRHDAKHYWRSDRDSRPRHGAHDILWLPSCFVSYIGMLMCAWTWRVPRFLTALLAHAAVPEVAVDGDRDFLAHVARALRPPGDPAALLVLVKEVRRHLWREEAWRAVSASEERWGEGRNAGVKRKGEGRKRGCWGEGRSAGGSAQAGAASRAGELVALARWLRGL